MGLPAILSYNHYLYMLRSITIITGMSGSGKHTLLKSFEDLGYYCIDNLPIALFPHLVSLVLSRKESNDQVAVVIDIREGAFLDEFPEAFLALRKNSFNVRLLFLETADAALVKRFSETRRPHPLAKGRSILEGIRMERQRLSKIKALADQIIDTTDFTTHSARRFIADHFQESSQRNVMATSLVSFGFKYGIPVNSDLVFDVRFLPNPFFVRSLKKKTGNDKPVKDFLNQHRETTEITRRIYTMIRYLHPRFLREGKSYFTVSIGCTGGRHRSVAVANAVGELLHKKGFKLTITHRDLGKDIE